MNGPEAAKKLREMGCNATIFGVTGNCLVEDVAFFKTHGADEVIPKPVKFARIEECWNKNDHKNGHRKDAALAA